jgi:hypothetical protein
MQTIEAIVTRGRVQTAAPLDVCDNTRCLVTILDEDLRSLRANARARLAPRKQQRLHGLLKENKLRPLSAAEERQLDQLLVEVHELMARKAEAARILDQLPKKR